MDVGQLLGLVVVSRKCQREETGFYDDSGEFRKNKRTQKSLKGQMFIVAAVLMLGGIVLIFNLLGARMITEEKTFQDSRVIDRTAKNIMNEYMFLTGAATAKANVTKSSADFAANFSAYIRSEMPSSIFYAIMFVNSTSQYSLNIGNYLNRRINVTVNVTDSTPSGGNVFLSDMQNSTLYFTPNINGSINVTINYMKGNADVTESFAISASTKNFILSFFDITIDEGSSQINIKDTYNRTWS